MLDGSDAIADWPLLNALVDTSSGATWVSIHHGGGVGIGRSIHAGQVSVADGTALAAEQARRVLTNDPGMGVIRHVDAGYDRAAEVAESAEFGSRCGRPHRPGRRDPHRRAPSPRRGGGGGGTARGKGSDERRGAARRDRRDRADEATGGYRRFAFTDEDAALGEWFAAACDAAGAGAGHRPLRQPVGVVVGPGHGAGGGRGHRQPPGLVPDGGAFDGPLGVVRGLWLPWICCGTRGSGPPSDRHRPVRGRGGCPLRAGLLGLPAAHRAGRPGARAEAARCRRDRVRGGAGICRHRSAARRPGPGSVAPGRGVRRVARRAGGGPGRRDARRCGRRGQWDPAARPMAGGADRARPTTRVPWAERVAGLQEDETFRAGAAVHSVRAVPPAALAEVAVAAAGRRCTSTCPSSRPRTRRASPCTASPRPRCWPSTGCSVLTPLRCTPPT